MLIIVPKCDLWFSIAPLGPLYIASVARNAGKNVEFLDANVEKQFMKKLQSSVPNHQLIGITCNISHVQSGLETASWIRKHFPDKKIIWGGPYPTIHYKDLIPEFADIVVIGEGETQISHICNEKDLTDIPGIAYWDQEKLNVNPRQDYIENLDEIPFPARDLIPDIRRYNCPGMSPLYIMITQRGCPFKCKNCSKFVHGDTYRTRSVTNVVDEIEDVVTNFGCRELHIWDDNFTLDPKRVKDICEEIIRRSLHTRVRLALPNGIRADINDEEMFAIMRKAGFYYVNVAIESGDQEVIDKLGKKLNLEKVNETIDVLFRNGYRIGLFFMMGLPFETVESLKKTISLATSLPAHHAHFFIFTPFPGTELFDMVQDKELLRRYENNRLNYDKEEWRFIHPDISEKELRHYHHLAYRRFYGNPVRLLRIFAALYREGVLMDDLCLLFRNGLRILTYGHR